MTLRFLPILLSMIYLSACVTPSQSNGQLALLQKQISDLEGSISSSVQSACDANTEQLSKKIHSDLREKLNAAEKSARQAKKKAKVVEKKCTVDIADKLVFGEVEKVFFEDAKVELDARVDTGAETSSLGVYKLTEFERDGKNWVRFKFSKSKKAAFYEYRIRDDVRIKQRKQDGLEQRFEIKITISVGDKKYRKQVFNLADRSHLDYQVLLGRSFLRDIAIVDVSLKKQRSKK